MLEKTLDIKMIYKQLPFRESDQLVFVADNSKIKSNTTWVPLVSTEVGIKKMLEWLS
jgi:CDP-paratose 2-epimerase